MHKVGFNANKSGIAKSNAGDAVKEYAQHDWVTVVNPTNHQKLLQACDHCGVVKSENSVTRKCRAPHSQSLLLSAGDRLKSVC